MSMTPREQLASATMIATHDIVLNLEKAKSSLESLIHDMQDLSCLVNAQGRIIWGNEKAASWLGVAHDLIHLSHLTQLFHEDDWQRFQQKLTIFANEGPQAEIEEFQIPIQSAQGRRAILWSLRPFQAISKRRGVILLLVGRDITEVLNERATLAKLETELETAQIMQAAFFPSDHIKHSSIEICSYYRPAEQCSGDWWGHFQLAEGVDLVCVGDVTGHGAASALVTAMTQATCMAYASQAKTGDAKDFEHPSRLLEQINRVVFDTFKGKFFMTFFAMLFDTNRGVLRVCNAGHNFPLYVRGMYREHALSGKALPELEKPFKNPEAVVLQGNPIGFDPATVFAEKELALHHLDRFVLFTDGIIECKNGQGQMFGASNFRKAINRAMAESGVAFRDLIIGSALDFYGKQPLADDLTFVSVDVFLKPLNQAS